MSQESFTTYGPLGSNIQLGSQNTLLLNGFNVKQQIETAVENADQNSNAIALLRSNLETTAENLSDQMQARGIGDVLSASNDARMQSIANVSHIHSQNSDDDRYSVNQGVTLNTGFEIYNKLDEIGTGTSQHNYVLGTGDQIKISSEKEERGEHKENSLTFTPESIFLNTTYSTFKFDKEVAGPNHVLKIVINGQDFYIPCYDDYT